MWILLRFRKYKAVPANKGTKASILVNTLWILLILSLLALALAWRISLELKLSSYFISQLKDFYAAKGAVFYAMEIVKRGDPNYDALNEDWANNPAIFKEKRIKVEEDTNFTISYIYGYDTDNKPIIYYGLIDEERRINLNLATDALAGILEKLKDVLISQNQTILTAEIINSILDWRDNADNLARPENRIPESEFYDYPCRNGEFKVLEELMLLKGAEADKDRFEKLKRYFTIYGSGKINVNTAGREILTASALLISSIPGMPNFDVPGLVNEILDRRQSAPFKNLNELLSLPSISDLLAGLPADSRGAIAGAILNIMGTWLDVKSSCFQVNVEAEIRGSIKKTLGAVFNRNDNQILYWYED